MESYEILAAQSEEKLKIADHLIGTTYPLVREPKLLVSVIENIYTSIDLAISALLEHEKRFVHMPSYGNDFDVKLDVFRRKIATKYEVSQKSLEFMSDIKRLLDEHKGASTEFARKGKFVMAGNDFKTSAIGIDDAKAKLKQARSIISSLLSIIYK